MIRILVRCLVWSVLTVVCGLILYGAAALGCALFPSAGRPQLETAADPPIYMCASLAHTDIVMPIGDDASDWRATFPRIAGDMPDTAYLAIGWGDLGFYRDTPSWSDLRPGIALRALSGLGPSTLHVIAVIRPAEGLGCLRMTADRAARLALARFVADSAKRDAAGKAILLGMPRQNEGFYAANGRYSPWRTCNVWASEALASAGLPAARWAPFSFGVIWPLQSMATAVKLP
jgi:uncharacterized protein (TIGR02117 family)